MLYLYTCDLEGLEATTEQSLVRGKIKGAAEGPPNPSEQAEYNSNSAGRPWVFGGLAQWAQDAGSWERSSERCVPLGKRVQLY